MENYIKYKLVGGQLRLKKDVVPHKFSCQEQEPEYSEPTVKEEIELDENVLDENIPSTSGNTVENPAPDSITDDSESDPLQGIKIILNKNCCGEKKYLLFACFYYLEMFINLLA